MIKCLGNIIDKFQDKIKLTAATPGEDRLLGLYMRVKQSFFLVSRLYHFIAQWRNYYICAQYYTCISKLQLSY